MAAPEVIVPLLEGIAGTRANATEAVAVFVKCAKEIMWCTKHKDQTDWEFKCLEDLDNDSAATATAPESGAVLYGLLIGQKSADASEDYVAVCDDADGTIAAFQHSDSRFTDAPKLQLWLQAAATDLTEEFTPYLFPRGVPFAAYMSFVADGEDGTAPDTNDVRVWALYRTGASCLL